MFIKSRKSPVIRPTANHADTRALGLVLAALPGFAFAAQPRAADTEERTLRGVVVSDDVEDTYVATEASSPKFTAPLLDTPQTVAVITKDLLQDQAIGSLAEALRNTPGITFTLGENGNTTAGDSITMRGFDTSGSIFLDGVRDVGAVARDTFNTEQIEIVKGPSGSDNGRGAPTGYINLSSKQPTLQDAVSSTLTIGSEARRRAEVDFNQTLGFEGSAARINLMYDEGNRPDRDVAENRRWGFAPAFAIGLGSDTRAYFNYLFIKQINVPDGGLTPLGLDGYNYVSAIAVTGSPAQQTALTNLNNAITAAVAAAGPVDFGNFYGSPNDREHVRSNQFTVRFEHDFAGATLRNTSRYGHNTLRRTLTGVNTIGNLFTGTANSGNAVITAPNAWTLSRSRQGRDEVNQVLTNQTNLTTSFETGPVRHSLSSGVEFIYERQLSRGMAAVGTTTNANLYAPSYSDSFAAVTRNGAFTDGKTLTGAVYLFDTLQLTEKFSVNLGARFDQYRTEYSNVPAPTTPPTAATFIEGDGTLLTGKLGLVFKPVDNGSIYAAIATSEQPPGGTNFTLSATATNINNPNLNPQKARNLEVGTKWELMDNRLVVNAAAFDTRNKNDLVQTDPNDATQIDQYGERQVRGIELGVAGMLTTRWQVTAGFATMDTEVKQGTAATTGAQITFSPKNTFTSWTKYDFPFGLSIGGGARFTDSQFRNANATQATVTNLAENPSVWVFDAMAAYEVNDRISVQLNVNNLADKLYFSSVNNGGSRFILGAPRTVLLSGRVQFY